MPGSDSAACDLSHFKPSGLRRIDMARTRREALMYYSGQNFTQVPTIFGSGYVPEQHRDESHRYLPISEKREPLVNFDNLLKMLRAALSLR